MIDSLSQQSQKDPTQKQPTDFHMSFNPFHSQGSSSLHSHVVRFANVGPPLSSRHASAERASSSSLGRAPFQNQVDFSGGKIISSIIKNPVDHAKGGRNGGLVQSKSGSYRDPPPNRVLHPTVLEDDSSKKTKRMSLKRSGHSLRQ